jgi:hypothetical protein
MTEAAKSADEIERAVRRAVRIAQQAISQIRAALTLMDADISREKRAEILLQLHRAERIERYGLHAISSLPEDRGNRLVALSGHFECLAYLVGIESGAASPAAPRLTH